MAGTDIWKTIDKLFEAPATRPVAVQLLVERMLAGPERRDVAAKLGISLATLARRLRTYPEIQEAIARAQSRSGRWVTFPDGRRERLSVALRERGIKPSTFYTRTSRGGMTETEALGKRAGKRRVPIEWKGRSLLPHEWAKETGIPIKKICNRRDRGWPPADILSPTGRKKSGM